MSAGSKLNAAYQLLVNAVADAAFPGAAYGVLHRGEVTTAAVGRFTYEQDSPAVQPETIYDIASVTKVVATTVIAMRLFERGVFRLDRPVHEILPEFIASASADQKRTITLRMLLAHSSGLPGWAPLYQTCADRHSLLRACYTIPLQHSPGAVAEYSDIGFILLGECLERLTGQSLAAFCEREIFRPLEMSRTQFIPSPAMRGHIPPSENDLAFRHRIIQGEVQDENCWVMGGVAGHAGIFSTAPDLLRFAACLFERRNGLLDPETIKLFTARESAPSRTTRALGWDTPSSENSASGHLFSPHSAGHLGYSGTSLWIDFDWRIAIVLLTNRCWPTRENHAIRAVRPAFHDAVMRSLGR